jgi:hypothetical protein
MTTIAKCLRRAGLVVAGTCAFAGSALAAEPSYSYLEAGYQSANLDDPFDTLDGFTIAGSLAVTDRFHLFATYLDGDADFDLGFVDGSVDLKRFVVGGGLNVPVGTGVDFVGRLAYVDVSADLLGVSEDGNGYALSAGLRSRLAAWELEGAVVYSDVEDEDDTTLDLAARWYPTTALSFGPTLSIGDDTAWGVAIRYEFE